MKKKFNISLPDYLTLDMYTKVSKNEGTDISKLVTTVAALLKIEEKDVKLYPTQLIQEIYKDLQQLALPKESFHALVEYNGTLYGYSDIHKMNLGCFVDMEEYCKDLGNNLHKIAALLYRPVVKNKFKSLEFIVNQGIRTALKQGVENPFEYYDIETYDSEKVEERWEEMKDFPSHILLGAIGFFLTVASMYSAGTASSKRTISKKMETLLQLSMKDLLLTLTGDGGQPFIDYLKPVSYQSQEISV